MSSMGRSTFRALGIRIGGKGAETRATSNIHTIYENGVFRPIQPVSLPDHREVEVEIRAIKTEQQPPSLNDVYAILAKRFSSGEHDVAARHNEHQP
jgi:predicted DNA-binding antitoxin AbrB/MazE fold protein